ncbi:MAG TPA: hypothetical protein VJK02_09295 [Anaerolineales bacterium]|nr:hypothetical protein [Anaerolineales bacterium]
MNQLTRGDEGVRDRFARVSVAGFLVMLLWVELGAGIASLLDGDQKGWAYLAIGIATILFWRSRRFWPIVSKSTSASFYPAGAFIANLGVAAMVIVPSLQYAADIPFVFYNTGETRTFVWAAVTSLISVGALVANVWVYFQDRRGG